MNNKLDLTNEQIESFGKEIEEIYQEAKSKIGQEDLDYILNVKRFSDALEIVGRSLIHISQDPLLWTSGSLLLGYHFLIEFSELGHNILHGQYDDIKNNNTVLSSTWKWDITMDEEDWKFEHHRVHHPFTNILGKDNDFGFLVYRVNDNQPWKLYHLFQVPMLLSMPLINSFFFPWYVATSRALAESRDVLTLETYLPSIQKVSKHIVENYIFFPMLPGGNYFKIAAGNFFAKLFQNIYLEMILAISHLHKDAYVFEEKDQESKGEFYLRQILSTVNFDSPPYYEIVYGAINLHIEHHLYPDLPPNRLREVAPKVKALCEKYEVPYRTGSFWEQFMGVIENALLRSLPIQPEDHGNIWKLLLNPVELTNRILSGFFNIGNTFSTNQSFSISEAEVIDVKSEIGGDAKSIIIQTPKEWGAVEWEAGSFISISFLINGKRYIRQYSLTNPDFSKKQFHITVKRVVNGKVSNYINDFLKKKDKITILGKPRGDFFLKKSNYKKLFIAGGAGITPILSMLRNLEKENRLSGCILIYFNRSYEKTLFLREIYELEKKGLKSKLYFDDYKEGFLTGSISKEIFDDIEDLTNREIYLCAPKGFIEKAKTLLKELEFPESKLFYENFLPDSYVFDPDRENVFHTVKFLRSNKEVVVNENTSLLKAIEAVGIKIPSGCLRGMCKSCQVVKTNGTTQSSFTKNQRERITTCNSHPRSDIELDI